MSDLDRMSESELREMESKGLVKKTPQGWVFTDKAKQLLGGIMGL